MIPAKYKFLLSEGAPRILVEALKIYGTAEIVGKKHNPVILQWAKDCGIKEYKNDEIPWCGLAMDWLCLKASKPRIAGPLWALNWNKWGEPVTEPVLGDILVFKRQSGGHVGIYVGEDNTCYHVLGGNQSNAFSITRIEKSRCVGKRRYYAVGMPANCRVIKMAADGPVSKNEV